MMGSNNFSQKQEKKIPLVFKVLLIVSGAVFLCGALFSFWFFFPVKNIPSSALLAPDTAAYFSITFDSKSPGINALKSRVKELILASNLSSFQKTLAGTAFSSFFPKTVSGIIVVDKDSITPHITGFASFGNEVKLIRLFSGYIDKTLFRGMPVIKQKEHGHPYTITKQPQDPVQKQLPVTAYTFINNNICLGTDPAPVKGVIKSYKEGYSAYPSLENMARIISDDQEQKDGYFFMDNSGGNLSKMIGVVEERFTFAAFPSIDSVVQITGSIMLSEEELRGSVRFKCKGTGTLEDVRADVKFFYQALRRLLRPRDLSLKGEITIQEGGVVFTYRIENFLDSIFNQINKNEGGEE